MKRPGSFRCAARGFVYCVRHERNLRIHLAAVPYVFIFSLFYGFSRAEYAVLALTCAFVISAELFNTSIEVVIDKISPKFSFFAMIGKDIAAGAVLVSAVSAVIVGITLFWDLEAFKRIFDFFSGSLPAAALLLISAVLAVRFVCSVKSRGGSPLRIEKGKDKK